MERVSFDIERQDVSDALHAQAHAAGRTVEAELAALVEQTYATKPDNKEQSSENWVEELIRIGGGVDLRIPRSRAFVRYAPDYPAGMEPLPDETFVDHITRISRPGVELEIERDRTAHEGFEL